MNKGMYGFPGLAQEQSNGLGKVSVITSSVTLTAGTLGYIAVNMASKGQSVTLPRASDAELGGPVAVIDNTKGGYPVGIRDSEGTLLMAVAPGGEGLVFLRDKSTAAGVWSVTGTQLEPGLITIDTTFSGSFKSTVLDPFVSLSDEVSLHFAALPSGFAAFVVDNAGKMVSAPVNVSTLSTSHLPLAVFKISSTQAIVFLSGNSPISHSAVVLTLTGTSPSYSISVGTATVYGVTMDSEWGAENFKGAPKIAQLSPTLYVSSYTAVGSGLTSVVAISVAGTVVTIGTAVNVNTSNSVANSTTTYALTPTSALVLYAVTNGSWYTPNAVVITVSGVTCSAGTSVTSNVNNNTSIPTCASCLLSPTKFIVSGDTFSSNVSVAAGTISGTTITFGAVFNVQTGSGAPGGMGYTADNATRYNPHLFPLSSTTFLIWYLASASISGAAVLTETAGTITAGTILYRSISTASNGSTGCGVILPQGLTEFVSLMQDSSVTLGTPLRLQAVKISGNTLTQGVSRRVEGMTAQAPSTLSLFARTSTGKYIGGTALNGALGVPALPVFSSNGDFINYSGSIAVPSLLSGASFLPAVASNRVVLLGATGFGSSAGQSINQLRLLAIELAK